MGKFPSFKTSKPINPQLNEWCHRSELLNVIEKKSGKVIADERGRPFRRCKERKNAVDDGTFFFQVGSSLKEGRGVRRAQSPI